jgi:O-methyltransferase involved in polyketide biosynthesis
MTLLMPLWGRAMEFKKSDPIIRDRYAYELVKRLDYDFEKIAGSFDEYYQIYWAARAYNIDCAISRLLADFPDAVIINIGAGLDTTFQRIDNGRVTWYDLDLPDTIGLRRELIPESDRNHYISRSVFDKSWYDDIKNSGLKVFFIASGVLCYFDEKAVKELFLDLTDKFPESEIIFDLTSNLIVWLSNREVSRRKDKIALSYLKWGARSSKLIKKWSDKIEVIDEYPVFSRIGIDSAWSAHTKSQIKKMNTFKWIKMVQLKFNR